MDIFADRARFSDGRLGELRSALTGLESLLKGLPSLTIYGVGSYARREASPHSDLDLFFVCREDRKRLVKPNETKFRLFGQLIQIVEDLGFEEFSGDCQYLDFLHTPDILEHLGGPIDDQMNYFTARMLLLLESCCVYGEAEYEAVKQEMVHSYFQDSSQHPDDFLPIFLLNDICRYWKTLLLNYENRRRDLRRAQDNLGDLTSEEREWLEREWTRNKVRNFKLKHSRMTTCFSSVAVLASCPSTVTEGYVVEVTKLTPTERLRRVAEQVPEVKRPVANLLRGYAWFLEQTALEIDDLEGLFREDGTRQAMDKRAADYGESMYQLLHHLDQNTSFPLLRYVVI